MLYQVLIFSFLAGITVFIGGLISYYFEITVHNHNLRKRIVHFSTAFVTGIMVAAVALVLVPKGMTNLNILTASLCFLLGAIVFYKLDNFIQNNKTNIPQVIAMLLDFIPESIALGALFVYDYKTGIVLALFIALQNLPESFNSYLELRKSQFSKFKSLLILFCLSFVGMIFCLLGFYALKDSLEITSALMIFASGGILYIIFQDIAPSFRVKNSRFLGIAVNLGFLVGLFAQAVV